MKETLVIILVLASLTGALFMAGIRAHYVASDSMAPVIPRHSLVITRTIEHEKDIRVRDVVVFSQQGVTMPIMHRAVSVAEDHIVTRGDANRNADGRIPRAQVMEKVHFHIPYAGYPLELMHTETGRIVSVTAIILLLAMALWPGRMRVRRNEETQGQS